MVVRVKIPNLFRIKTAVSANNNTFSKIENISILWLPQFEKFGKPSKIASYFGGKQGYLAAVRELEQTLYEVAV